MESVINEKNASDNGRQCCRLLQTVRFSQVIELSASHDEFGPQPFEEKFIHCRESLIIRLMKPEFGVSVLCNRAVASYRLQAARLPVL